MLSFPTPNVYQSAKCFLTYGTMSHPDPTQLPTKGKPWSTLLSQGFIHRVDLVIPREALKKVRAKLDAQCPVHYRVIMKLGDIISGEFFKEYIKIGNIMMLSEGRIGTDNVFTLKDGTLTLYLEKETYERVGIVGQPHGVKGRRGTKPRWIVQYDLRNPSSFAGKKGFDRLVYACDNVLNQPVTWLFCNLSKTPDPDPLQSHFPTKYSSSPLYVETVRAIVPSLKPPQAILESGGRDNLVEFATCIYEWLSLLRLESPRANADDKIDPYLSRYAVPGAPEELQEAILCKVSWQGFMSPTWTRQTLVDIILATSSQSWFSLSVASFGKGVSGEGTECSILRPPNSPGEYFLWDIHGHE
ncbi:ribonuclease P 40kDa subunit [Pseudomassariella vexata]|uniref:Ribonuclease P 40kDa subunit n=1 Tax=Pseudomassariella vexata TaxID=1141098 RepID=A0A1Y2DTA1_9PEZI|nr:ribonuclease P 40kDa subunit [Pseudomassariella vexata]ORY62374.1 ribonuclease P 40kDa subunit [Pseudomassariella vexata]